MRKLKFTGPEDYADFIRSGGTGSRRILAAVNRKKRLYTKAFHRYITHHPSMARHRAPAIHKQCPVCGRSRRAGYIRCCPNCYPYLQAKEDVNVVLDQLADPIQAHGARLRWQWHDGLKDLRITVSIHTMNPHPHHMGHNLVFTGCRSFSYHDLVYPNGGLKDLLMNVVADLFRAAQNEMGQYVDQNGNVMLAGRVPVPVAGNWRKDVAPFTRGGAQ